MARFSASRRACGSMTRPSRGHFYVSVFRTRDQRRCALRRKRFRDPPPPAGSVLTVTFELDGQSLMALNGGPVFKFTEAISLMVSCDTQDESTTTGTVSAMARPVGAAVRWLKDRYGSRGRSRRASWSS